MARQGPGDRDGSRPGGDIGQWGGPSSAGSMAGQDRAVVGLEMAAYGLSGAGTDGPRVWHGVLGHGQGQGSPRGGQGH